MAAKKRTVKSRRRRQEERELGRIQRVKLEPHVASPKPGRNDPCQCGRLFNPERGPNRWTNRRSKFKECCGFSTNETSFYQPCQVRK